MKKMEPIEMTAEEIVRLYPDGDDISTPICRDRFVHVDGNGYYCTRDKEHIENHVAYGLIGKPLAMWRDKTLLWERSGK